MKVAVIGSRNFSDYNKLKTVLDEVSVITQIVSGGARGADTLAERYAKLHNIPTLIHKPEWNKYGKAAGMIRNKLIIEHADLVIAFWDGSSPGTKHSIKLCEKTNKKVQIVYTTENSETSTLNNFFN